MAEELRLNGGRVGYKTIVNPYEGTLQLVNFPVDLSGDVIGPASATDKAIARYDGTTGKLIQNSLTLVQDSGAIEAQGFLTRRSVIGDVMINSGESWIAPELEIELTGSIEIESDGELIII